MGVPIDENTQQGLFERFVESLEQWPHALELRLLAFEISIEVDEGG